jgi:hypothetical protein
MTKTTASTPGLSVNEYGLYPATEDYLAFVFIPSEMEVINTSMGGVGENLKIWNNAAQLMNSVLEAASMTGVMVDKSGNLLNNSTNQTIAQNAINLLFVDNDGNGSVYSQLDYLINGSGELSYSVSTYLEQVYNDLAVLEAVYTNNASAIDKCNAYAFWYAGELYSSKSYSYNGLTYPQQDTEQNIINAVYAVESVSSQQEAKLQEVMFLYEMFIKSASSILAGVDQTVGSLAINVRSS